MGLEKLRAVSSSDMTEIFGGLESRAMIAPTCRYYWTGIPVLVSVGLDCKDCKTICCSFAIIVFSQCPQEESLDRDLPAQHVLNHLGNISDHAMHLDELWEQRDVKLKSHKRFSSQFFDFEKEIRKVIDLVVLLNAHFKWLSSKCFRLVTSSFTTAASDVNKVSLAG